MPLIIFSVYADLEELSMTKPLLGYMVAIEQIPKCKAVQVKNTSLMQELNNHLETIAGYSIKETNMHHEQNHTVFHFDSPEGMFYKE